MNQAEAMDVIRFDALDGLATLLEGLTAKVESLRDDLTPEWLTLVDVETDVRQLREHLEAMDAIGWHSAAQMERAEANRAAI